MPKNKKPGGGRAAKNFDPRYNPKYRAAGGSSDEPGGKRRPGESSTGKPGSRSPGHRGYRAEPAADPRQPGREGGAPKRRWTEQERAGRDDA
ncbi:ATP-dependent helicase, partial [Microbacterium arthrosphaerae]